MVKVFILHFSPHHKYLFVTFSPQPIYVRSSCKEFNGQELGSPDYSTRVV